jgi:uncharacterized membrane protein YwzB
MGSSREWITILGAAALWAVGMPLSFHLEGLLSRRFSAMRRERVLLRAHPIAFVFWGLAGVDWGLFFLFGSRVLHGRLLVILVTVSVAEIVTILMASRFASLKLN